MAQVPQDNQVPGRMEGPVPVGSVIAAQPTSAPSTTARAGRAVREIVETLVLAAVIFFAVRLVVLNFKVDGESMLPNLHNEEMLLVNRNAYVSLDFDWLDALLPGEDAAAGPGFYPFSPPERGDIIVFDPPSKNGRAADKPYIKRIIGLPGERITFADHGVYVNGQRLDEPYITEDTDCDGNPRRCDVVVPEDNVFVLGDNRTNSTDSRVFGPVAVERVIGKAWLAYWPPADAGLVPHHDYPGIAEMPANGVSAATPVVDERNRRGDREERPRRQRLGNEAATPIP